MLTKFETKSNRVKGLSFHPKRPWILASLHSGVIQLWDYRMGTLIDRFDEHEGPVRGVHFHPTQPLFVSGGDDYKIKVWNYKTRRCLFTLLGHLDYIRTVSFHHDYPWIVSASDDQTIRLWNWQSRTCISVLTGHNHYVMCAAFHPRDDLVVSASLDQTVRVWDIGELRRKSVAPRGGAGGGGSGGLGGPGSSSHDPLGPPASEGPRVPQVNVDLFGSGDAVVKYVLEGHDRGVNWAAFHPTLPLIASGADDRTVKLWRMNDTKAWEVDTLRGHVNNVSCVAFHARADVIVSDSEDRSLRVWDLSKRVGVQTFRREHDRFWILAVHPNVNLLAAGHDSGMLVFKLARERPASTLVGDSLLYVRDRSVRRRELSSGRDVAIAALRRNPAAAYNQGARSVQFSPAEGALLVQSDVDGGTYDLYALGKGVVPGPGGAAAAAASQAQATGEPKRGPSASSAFVARNRFATLDRATGAISVRDLNGDVTRRVSSPLPGTDAIFPAGPGLLLLRSEERVALLDVQQRTLVAELATPPVRYVVWSADGERVALLAKHAVVLADRRLGDAATVHETVRVKSGAWDPEGVFVYSTLNHLKYALPSSGDSGTLRTLPDPLYVVRVGGGVVHALDREAQPRAVQVDAGEYRFKLALAREDFPRALAVIRAGGLCGQAIVGYLQEKGYPEVALHFAEEPRLRLELALACGDVEVALEAASALDEAPVWERLGASALRAGNHAVVEFAYQRTRAYERLAVLYALTGARDKLLKMARIAEMRGDARARFHVSLLTADGAERVKVLEEAGLVPLAYLAAKAAGLEDKAEELSAAFDEAARARADDEREALADDEDDADGAVSADAVAPDALPQLPADSAPLLPPVTLLKADNWPLLSVSKGTFEALAADGEGAAAAIAAAGLPAALDVVEGDRDAADAAGWGGDDGDLDLGEAGPDDAADDLAALGLDDEAAAGSGGWDVDELDIPLDVGSPRAGGPGGASASGTGSGAAAPGRAAWAAPSEGPPLDAAWRTRCRLAPELAAAGAFEEAVRLLSRQLGIVRFEPLREGFLNLRAASGAYAPLLPGWDPADVPLDAGGEGEAAAGGDISAPRLLHTVASLREQLRVGFAAVTAGRFGEAAKAFDAVLHAVPLVVVDTAHEAAEVETSLRTAGTYALAVRVEQARREAKDDPKRAAELAAYFSHSGLEPAHAKLALRSAMSLTFKLKCFATCATFARRLLDAGVSDPKLVQQVKAVLAACERSPQDAVQLDYDPRAEFVVCAASLTPIYKGGKSVSDPYTGARFRPEYDGTLSTIGGISRVGAEASGLVCLRGQQ